MVCINEHKVGSRGCVTHRRTHMELDQHEVTAPLPPELRREAYFTWEQSADLRDCAHSPSAFHPLDWDRRSAVHEPGHPSIDSVLASRGYAEDGTILS